ncbi:C-type lectin protein [Truncatella angustata]|uniref:C-type lectin protein n=1 Tax=Truncatella angustata TaxID=152316 RepID=A0A9P8UPY5_9PEZI|nr:C-type lectin protein [Truncatella angustata]KAH6656045.1 C-type lectin protein [Truncatella angustata]
MNLIKRLQTEATSFGFEPLLILPSGRSIQLAYGYIPLLVSFTHEDKAAKGLRKRKPDEKPKPPVYFSALELVRDERILLLTGAAGSGKTSFAKHLSYCLANGSLEAQPLVRNELGMVYDESWEAAGRVLSSYFTVDNLETLRGLRETTLPELVESWSEGVRQGARAGTSLLIILDTVEKAESREGRELLASIVAFVEKSGSARLLVLGETEALKNWVLPPAIARHELLPLLVIQRQHALDSIANWTEPATTTEKGYIKKETCVIPQGTGAGAAAALPAIFALALHASHSGSKAEDTLDAWLAVVCPSSDLASRLSVDAFDRVVATVNKQQTRPHLHRDVYPSSSRSMPWLASTGAVQQLLAARHLANLVPDAAVELFHLASSLVEPTIQSVLGTLSTSERQRAGCILSRLGDPRDLTALTIVPFGTFIFGSRTHPNSQPVEPLSLRNSFRIGIYPVVNREYALFIKETRRAWLSPDGFTPEYRNAPATDLTWFDARAYCVWLTKRWHADGSIDRAEEVRLPTEPEWERAARGNQNCTGEDCELVYPWGTKWLDDGANSDESGLNRQCAVGLFPTGRSPYGCYDMAGQVWEWCSTLWGEDMATPSFKYPYRDDDGREALCDDVPGHIRRVLRGGCFSSARAKVCCTYRGSLEPAGFWRGNGFRIVVAPVAGPMESR